MKTIIISDIEGKSDSIIPYGLNIGKHTRSEVDILHIVDRRKQQGVSSSYANSQSITPGEVLSHEEIQLREKNRASLALHKLLSAEASRLDYPLKIDVKIEMANMEKGIRKTAKEYPGSLFIHSLEPANSMVSDLNELLSIMGDLGSMVLIVPPEQKFAVPEKVMVLTDFTHDSHESIHQAFDWLSAFDPLISTFGITRMKHFVDMEMKSAAWKQVVEGYLDSRKSLKTNVITGANRNETILNYVRRNDPDMVLLPKLILKPKVARLITGENSKQLITALKKPLLLY